MLTRASDESRREARVEDPELNTDEEIEENAREWRNFA
jgi:hypothetical protein